MTRRQCLFALASGIPAAAKPDLPERWRRIAGTIDGVVGAAALHLGTGVLVSMNGDDRFPLASVCKLPLAMNMLALVDEGKFALDQNIEVLPADVWAGVSEIEKRWPAEKRFPLSELIRLVVAKSDNTAEETLYRIGGEGPAMAARFRQWKIEGVRVDRSERQCSLDRDRDGVSRSLADPRDTGTPNGTVQLLARAFHGEVLSRASSALLIEILKATTTFPTRIKGLLPRGTVVAHKTGTVPIATNDSGVIFLPDGAQLAVSVYIKGSTSKDAARDGVIAQIARTAFDSYKK